MTLLIINGRYMLIQLLGNQQKERRAWFMSNFSEVHTMHTIQGNTVHLQSIAKSITIAKLYFFLELQQCCERKGEFRKCRESR